MFATTADSPTATWTDCPTVTVPNITHVYDWRPVFFDEDLGKKRELSRCALAVACEEGRLIRPAPLQLATRWGFTDWPRRRWHGAYSA